MATKKKASSNEVYLQLDDAEKKRFSVGVGGARFPRMQIDAKGFTLTWLDGRKEMSETVEGSVIDVHPLKTCYLTKRGESADGPPDCLSIDNQVGHGNPGGPCGTCDENWSPTNTNAKCKTGLGLWFLPAGEEKVLFLKVAYNAAKNWTAYSTELMAKGEHPANVRTVLSISIEKSPQGTYPEIQFASKGRMPAAQMPRVAEVYRLCQHEIEGERAHRTLLLPTDDGAARPQLQAGDAPAKKQIAQRSWRGKK